MKKQSSLLSTFLLKEKTGIERFVSLEELERALGFTFAPTLSFATPQLETSLREIGLKNLKNHEIHPEHLRNGELWAPHIESSLGLPTHAVSIRFVSNEVGYGLFTEEDLPENFFLIEYVGKVRKNDNRLFISDYLYTYPIADEIGRPFVVDAHQGGLARFINHSYTPNLSVSYGFIQGIFHIGLTTLTPLSKETQLTYNYGNNYWYTRNIPEKL